MLDTPICKIKQLTPVSVRALVISVLSAFVSAFSLLFLTQKLFIHAHTYPDFIVGAITWEAATKLQDLASYPAFFLGFLVGGWGAYRLIQQSSIIRLYEHEQALITVLTWWLVPVAIGMGGFLSIYPNHSSFLIYMGSAGAIVTLLAVRLHSQHGDDLPQQVGISVLAIMLLGLLPLGIETIQDRLPLFGEELRFSEALRVGMLLEIVATLYLFYLCRSSSTSILRNIPKLLLVAQLGIAPFYLLVLPDLYIIGTGGSAIQTATWLWVLAFSLVFAAVVDVIVRYKNFALNHSPDFSKLLSPIAIFATIILLRNGSTVIPHVSSDDYHFGESLLGWWSFLEFGKIPYIDYFQPHGVFGDDIGGFISRIFYDGTAATLAEADRLAATLTMFVAFMALRIYTGSIGLAYVSILLFGTIARKLFFLILVPFYCLWLKTSNLKPQTWLWIWLVSAIVLILLVPPQGLLAVIASLPVVALHLYRARQSDWKREGLLLAILVILLGIFTPISAMLYGAIRYVLENGPINQIAYGIPWSSSKGEVDAAKLEMFRMSWVWVPLLAAVLMIVLFKQREHRPYLIGVALPVLLFASLLTPYTMGRIDPAAMSRPGIFANFAWAILLPILLSPLLATRGRAVLAVSIAFVCAGIGLANVNKEGINSVLEKNQVGNLWIGAEHSLKNMGTGVVDPQHIDRLERINSFLNRRLAPRETYLDLTGRNAQYMYFDRPPAISTTAPYNLVAIKQQQRIVKQLDKTLPSIALIEADNINHDGGGMALRSHILYRFVLKNYHAELHDGYVYGFTKVDDAREPSIDFTLRQLTDLNWEKGIHRSENALIIRDTLSLQYLQVGDELVLPDATSRKITKIWPEGNAIWFDGLHFVPNATDSQCEIQVLLNDSRRKQLSAQLMEHVFAVADLRKIPVAWGQSASSLGNVMKPIVDLNFAHTGSHDLKAENNSYRIVGIDPYLWLDLTPKNITGQSAGLLKFDLACEGGANPQIQVFWWGDDRLGADELHSLHFTAANGTVIVPLDAYPDWLEMKKVKGLRIDLEAAETCQTLSIQNATLNQRTNF
jgi:hypothetical protein